MIEQVPPSASPTPPPDWAMAPPPHQQPGWSVPLAPAKKTLGIWALVLCALSIIPFAWLVGSGLAIAALVKSTNGRDFGKKYAIAALVIAALWMGAVLGLIAFGAISGWNEDHLDRDDSGAITEEQDTTLAGLRVGDCFNSKALTDLGAGEETSTPATLAAVPCDDQHAFEIYHTFDLVDPEFPGTEAVSTLAVEGCREAFSGYVGVSYDRSRLGISYFYPTENTWKFLSDRSIVCYLHEGDYNTTGTLRGAKV